jgi:molecular chaperone GrpE (heat shock protein)
MANLDQAINFIENYQQYKEISDSLKPLLSSLLSFLEKKPIEEIYD